MGELDMNLKRSLLNLLNDPKLLSANIFKTVTIDTCYMLQLLFIDRNLHMDFYLAS